jgi:hypothetical protein
VGVFRRLQSDEVYDAISTSQYYRHYLCSKLECRLFSFDIKTIAMLITRGELKDILRRWSRHLSPAEGTQTSHPYMKHGIAVSFAKSMVFLGLRLQDLKLTYFLLSMVHHSAVSGQCIITILAQNMKQCRLVRLSV